uniref:Uncharacterized protein n=1 Tax=Panagrolaimus davidi TaxID=227884 RepID=A0A914QHI9_9BILA
MNTVSTINNKYSNNDDTFNATKKLDPRHSFTAEWLILSLRENDNTFGILHGDKAIKDVTSYDISIGKGFISIVLKCTVTFVNYSDDESYTTILKIPGFDSFIDAQNSVGNIEEIVTEEIKESFVTIHQSECDFYNKISKLIDAPIPKIFKTVDWILEKKQEGCIHMEDLTIRGKTFESYDRINIAQAKCFVRYLAKMHKNILTVDPEVWKGKYLKGQTTLAGHIEHQRLHFGGFLEGFKLKARPQPRGWGLGTKPRAPVHP